MRYWISRIVDKEFKGANMKSSINLGKIFGIDLKMNITFLFLLLWVGFSSLFSGASAGDAVTEIGFIIALFVLVVLHELGHALMAKRYGIKTKDITLLPIGGLARLEKMPEESLPLSGDLEVWPFATTEYKLTAYGKDGSTVSKSLVVNIVDEIPDIIPEKTLPTIVPPEELPQKSIPVIKV